MNVRAQYSSDRFGGRPSVLTVAALSVHHGRAARCFDLAGHPAAGGYPPFAATKAAQFEGRRPQAPVRPGLIWRAAAGQRGADRLPADG